MLNALTKYAAHVLVAAVILAHHALDARRD